MATTGSRLVLAARLVDLAPLAGLQVEAPHVVKLLVVVLLAAEHIHLLVVDSGRDGGALCGPAHSLFLTGQQVSGTVSAFMLELNDVVDTGAINVTAKSAE